MEKTTYISVTDICNGYRIEKNYILKIKEFGFIKFVEEESEPRISSIELPKLEKILRFHRELKINFEGIEVILNLLKRIEDQNDYMRSLEKKLQLYESS